MSHQPQDPDEIMLRFDRACRAALTENKPLPDFQAFLLPEGDSSWRQHRLDILLIHQEYALRGGALPPLVFSLAERITPSLDRHEIFRLVEAEYLWCWQRNRQSVSRALYRSHFPWLEEGTEGELNPSWDCPQCTRSVVETEEAIEVLKCPNCNHEVARTDLIRPERDKGSTTQRETHEGNSEDRKKPPVAVLGPYRLGEHIGGGGMGDVFEGHSDVLKHDAAVKTLRTDQAPNELARRRFLREVQAASALKCDHIVPIWGYAEEKGVAYITMPRLRGEDLKKRLEREKRLETAEVIKLARQVCIGLAEAHAKGLVHRDIKPSNIFLEQQKSVDWRTVLLDFGLARPTDGSNDITDPLFPFGTAPYMSPEQVKKEREDARSDLFSLGAVLYEAATGERAFKGESTYDLLHQIVEHQPTAPHRLNLEPGVPEGLSTLIMKLLEKKPEHRPRTAGEVLKLLDAIEAPNHSDNGGQTRVWRSVPRLRWSSRLRDGARALSRRRGSLATLAILGIMLIGWLSLFHGRHEIITNSMGMRLVLVPAGEFEMGGADSDVKVFDNEKPRHKVNISKPFYMGIHEVTRGQFRRFIEATGYRTLAEENPKGGYGWNESPEKVLGDFQPDKKFNWRYSGFEQTDIHPVVIVGWRDAEAFCKWLTQLEGKTYRLPTEAEWEYACRANTETIYACGDDPELLGRVGNVGDGTVRKKYSHWEREGIKEDDGFVYTAPVGKFLANQFGLFDMHGNVWELCLDGYDKTFYKRTPEEAVDPLSPINPSKCVKRGGGWCDAPVWFRSSVRQPHSVGKETAHVGFRVVMEVPTAQGKRHETRSTP